MTRNEFIMEIKDELRGTCALPYSVPDEEINRIVNQALKYFYRNYKEAVESKYYIITKDQFNTPQFKSQRAIAMPDCVVNVVMVKEIAGGSRLGSIDSDFSDNRLMAAELYMSPFQSDDLVLRTAQYSYWDLTSAFFLEMIAFGYNQNTKKLKIKGRDPKKDVWIDTYAKIPEEDLFEDWFFIRYATAQTKIALGRILGFFEYQLPGGVTVNYQSIKDEGTEELEKILQQIDDENSPDWFQWYH